MNSRKKLLQINTVVNYGSTGQTVEETGQIARANGFDSYVAYGRHTRVSESNLIRIGTGWDITFHVVKTRLFDKHGLGSVVATRRLINQIVEIQPDIIHLRNLHGYYLNYVLLFKYLELLKKPIIWTFHDCWPMTGHCTHFDHIHCEKWRTGCYNCPQLHQYPASLLFDNSRENYNLKRKLFTSLPRLTIVAVSKWLGNIVEQSFFARYPIRVIYNGVDNELFSHKDDSVFREKLNLKGKFIILGVAYMWNNRKGLMDFVELSKRLDSNFHIILVGLTKAQIKSLPKNITGIERTESPVELAKIYSTADVFVNPSVEETFGKTTIEALSCGTPGIVYNATASPELLTPDTGFIVEKGNISEIHKAIMHIQDKGKDYYKPYCVERVKRHFNKNDRWMEYINLYNSELDN